MSAKEKVADILKEVISEVTPTKKESQELTKQSKEVIQKLSRALKGQKVSVVVGGSGSKNTQLRNSHDVDFFVLFDYKKHHEHGGMISDILEKSIKKVFKTATRIHGSRDYFQVKHTDHYLEIIPILKLKNSSQAKNITDVSPLHTKWVNKKIGNKREEVRLLKAFCKAQGVYGAESYVRGFSGYACEILAIHYKSFINVLKIVSRWKNQQVIDPENYYKNKNPLLSLNKSKIQSPLVIIDPVQSSRNVAAALSEESLNKFKTAAKKFLSNPTKQFFIKKTVTKKELVERIDKKSMLLVLEIATKSGKRDVIGAALLNRYHLLLQQLNKNSFSVKKKGWEWDEEKKAMLWYLIDKKMPSKYEVRKGPNLTNPFHSKRFKKLHKKTFVKNKRMYANVLRKYSEPKKLIADIVKSHNFKDKIKSVKIEWH